MVVLWEKMKESLKGYPIVHVLVFMEGKGLKNIWTFKSKVMSNQILKSTFLCNLLLWVRMCIDGGFLVMIDFNCRLESLWRDFCFSYPCFFSLWLLAYFVYNWCTLLHFLLGAIIIIIIIFWLAYKKSVSV